MKIISKKQYNREIYKLLLEQHQSFYIRDRKIISDKLKREYNLNDEEQTKLLLEYFAIKR